MEASSTAVSGVGQPVAIFIRCCGSGIFGTACRRGAYGSTARWTALAPADDANPSLVPALPA
jgi:hypothetical protein